MIGRKKKVEVEAPDYVPKKKKVVDPNKPMPLITPDGIQYINFIRCNCSLGVPRSSKFFEPVPRKYILTKDEFDIKVKMYDDIKFAQPKSKKVLLEEEEAAQQRLQDNMYIIIPIVMRFIHLGRCADAAVVSKAWNLGANLYREYVDMRDCLPWQAFRPHRAQVDTIALKGNKVYSGGDKCILCSDIARGEVLAQITRDSGDIPFICIYKSELFCASVNGSIRAYGLTHNPHQTRLNRTIWDHSKCIKGVSFALPSPGPCFLHGIDGHICTFATASEDRSVRISNLENFKSVASLQTKSLQHASYTALCQSPAYLFVGTSISSVMIFSNTNNCCRDDVHKCSIPGANKLYCLQITLKLPPMMMGNGYLSVVSCMLCTGPSYTQTHLWVGDSCGQMTVWIIPLDGLDFKPLKTWKAHDGIIRAMTSTWKHMISVADDGNILFHDLSAIVKIRSINVAEWCSFRNLIPDGRVFRSLKCLAIEEDFENGGTMVVGTNYGEIIVFALGSYI